MKKPAAIFQGEHQGDWITWAYALLALLVLILIYLDG